MFLIKGESMMECLGCKLANEEEKIYKIYEDDYVTCFLDHEPFYTGHTLIVPKQHVVEVDELDDVVAKSIMDASKLIAKAIKVLYKPDGITICQNGGIFNELTHYHMHVVPRYKERSFAEFYTVQSGEKKNHNLEEIKTLLKEEIEQVLLTEKA
ncbi:MULTISPECIES: HIT family protein [Bacillus]|uniref:HIT family protein n=6 Tax=Bacillus cereus group TaxID=86661 RepID=A0AAW7NAM0_BACCE|nr:MULTISPECIES: HIT family protein [Bacillus]MDV8112208.1 HIT family protein [Bacillus sp. BAU-SS-2023]MBY0133516.1 HIT family protein [Bacillus cereus]MCB5904140.1 HIT family protein [Bacillus cereus]MCJ0850774.1 HIT family protein [Bacillus cereus]MCP1138120.1 HIT family protein [Bacillus cereus]